jgi:thiol-disulfide isomerase/thioredoxin
MKRALLVLMSLIVLLVASGYVLYARNTAPTVAAISSADVATHTKPFVIKLHAQWCIYCMLTKDVWAEIEQAYAGRVNLVVLDFTTDSATAASKAEATRLGLTTFYEEHEGATGGIVVLDGRTKEVKAAIYGRRDLAEYRAAIDAVLTNSPHH